MTDLHGAMHGQLPDKRRVDATVAFFRLAGTSRSLILYLIYNFLTQDSHVNLRRTLRPFPSGTGTPVWPMLPASPTSVSARLGRRTVP